jgi:hypothetical protein
MIEFDPLSALDFYQKSYDLIHSKILSPDTPLLPLGSKPFKCRFCGGTKPTNKFKHRAHAIPECLGNKTLISLYECDKCNERFAKFDDDLAKMVGPFRTLGEIEGKRGVPALLSETYDPEKPARVDYDSNNKRLHLKHHTDDTTVIHDDEGKKITFRVSAERYRPLGAYKALCKSAMAILPDSEIIHFNRLLDWLESEDLNFGTIDSNGAQYVFRSIVSGFKPFPETSIFLLRRKSEIIDTPYMTFLIAFGNVSYQLFLPCPAKDEFGINNQPQLVAYPLFYVLPPGRVTGSVTCDLLDLSSPSLSEKHFFECVINYKDRQEG